MSCRYCLSSGHQSETCAYQAQADYSRRTAIARHDVARGQLVTTADVNFCTCDLCVIRARLERERPVEERRTEPAPALAPLPLYTTEYLSDGTEVTYQDGVEIRRKRGERVRARDDAELRRQVERMMGFTLKRWHVHG